MVKIISAFPTVVCYLINLTNNLAQFSPSAEIILAIDQNFPFHLFSNLNRSQTFFRFNRFSNQAPRLHFDIHQLKNIQPFEGTPTAVEF